MSTQTQEPTEVQALPWQTATAPQVRLCDATKAAVRVTEGGGRGLVLTLDGQEFSRLDTENLVDLALYYSYPTQFIEKLPLEMQAAIINNRIQAAPSQPLQWLAENDKMAAVTTAWRDVVPHQAVCQTAWDSARAVNDTMTVKQYSVQGNQLNLSLISPRNHDITPTVGDTLNFGVRIRHQFGVSLEAQLFNNRLVCDNGMTTETEVFSWKSKSKGTANDQLGWLSESVANCLSRADTVVQKARELAQIEVTGEPVALIRQRAQALRIPRRHWDGIYQMFEQEPGNTEWHLVNAVTRYASHSDDIDQSTRDRIGNIAGKWVGNHEIVTARLPRTIAERFGAEILSN